MKNGKADNKVSAPKRKKPCGYCGGDGQHLDLSEDFCPHCAHPSKAYQRMVNKEWEAMLDKLDQRIGY